MQKSTTDRYFISVGNVRTGEIRTADCRVSGGDYMQVVEAKRLRMSEDLGGGEDVVYSQQPEKYLNRRGIVISHSKASHVEDFTKYFKRCRKKARRTIITPEKRRISVKVL